MNKKNIIVIALVLLVIIVFMWTNSLNQITVGHKWGGNIWAGATEAQAATQRANTNTTYGLFAAVIVVGAGALIYLNKQKDKS